MKDNNKLHQQLSIIFWLNFTLFVFGFLALLYIKGPDFGTNIESSVTYERYAIIITLASIPLALKLFHNMISKTLKDNKNELIATYKKAYFTRLAILDIAALVSILGFFLYEANNFIYMTIVILAALLFCFPNKDLLADEEIEDRENNLDIE